MKLILGKVYYGWWILVGAILAQFVSVSTGQMVSGIFLNPIVEVSNREYPNRAAER